MNDGGAVWRFGDLEVHDGELLPKPATVEQAWALLLILYVRETQTCGFVEYVQQFMDAYEKIDAGDSDMVQKADPTELGLFKKVKTELETTGVPPHIQAAALPGLAQSFACLRKKAMTKRKALHEARRRWGPRATVWSHRSPSRLGQTCYLGIKKDGVIVQMASGPDWVTAFWYADRGISDWPDRPRFVIPDRGE